MAIGKCRYRAEQRAQRVRLVDFLPALYAIGMLSIFVTRQNQRLGDLAAGTLVVRERPGGIRSAEAAPRFARPVADGWDVSAVSAADIGTVRRFLDRRQTLDRRPARGARPRARAAAAPAGRRRARGHRFRGVPRAPLGGRGLKAR